ncbi:MAG: protein kinase [Luteolibacter sp.]
MEERYEIRAKIGQGGLGAVYRGYDTRMNREVAIKRISTTTEDPDLEEESTRQLIKEAGALASLQHPHIVTIYDVGSDEDGPYVVMELISGKTLDELIERAPLTWQDFRELALQTQEALIAAQELDLIHSDIKPSNLMLTWLPSGKFQVKIVDFGLATLTHSQSKEELEELETVFGSIFFMAPEQFERVPLDARTDMYAMGCVYYQALAGIYPFDGTTGVEVMNAHLNHQVTPLQEVRSGIPIWACDWIMWLINRMASDRPASAREALQVFLQNDKAANPKMSTGMPPSAQTAAKATPGTGPQPRLPRPSTPAMRIQPGQVATATTSSIPVPAAAAPTAKLTQVEAITKTAPQPLLPPEGSKPSVHTSPQQLPEATPPLTSVLQMAAAQGAATSNTQPIRIASTTPVHPSFLKHKKHGLGKREKMTIALVLGVVAVAFGLAIVKFAGQDKSKLILNEILLEAAKSDVTALPIDKTKLVILLQSAGTTEANPQRPLIYTALAKAKASDDTDVDRTIADFTIKKPELSEEVRESMMREVIKMRRNPTTAPALITFAKSATDPRLAAAALQAVRFTATEEQFPQFLEIIQITPSDDTRKAAEEALAEVIGKSGHASVLAGQLGTAYVNASSEKIRQTMLRLIARCGGEQAILLVKNALGSPEKDSKAAAITALGLWPDESAYPILIGFLATTQDAQLRGLAFDSAYGFVSEPGKPRKPQVVEDLWTKLAPHAKTADQQKKFIGGLTDYGTEPWAFRLIDSFAQDKKNDPAVVKLAEQTLNRLRGR